MVVHYLDDGPVDLNCYVGSETHGSMGVTIWGPYASSIWLPPNGGGWTGFFTCTQPDCYAGPNFCLLTYTVHTTENSAHDVKITQTLTSSLGTNSVDIHHSALANNDDTVTHEFVFSGIYNDIGQNTIDFVNHGTQGIWIQELQVVRGYTMKDLETWQQATCSPKVLHSADQDFTARYDYPCNYHECGGRSVTVFTPDDHYFVEQPGTDPGTIIVRGHQGDYTWTWNNPPQPSGFNNYLQKSHCLFNFNNVCLINDQKNYGDSVGASTVDVPFEIQISSSLGTSNWKRFYHPGNNTHTLNAHIAHGVDLATDNTLSAYYNDAPGSQNTLRLRIPVTPNNPGVNFLLCDSGTMQEGYGYVNLYRIYETKPCCPTITSNAVGAGSISPTPGPYTVPSEGRTFDMSAAPGSQLSNVSVDGTSKGPSDPYTVHMSDLNMSLGMGGHTISASFPTGPFTITVIGAGDEGYQPQAWNLYPKYYGNTFQMSAQPNQYHTFQYWQCTAGSIGIANIYAATTTFTVQGSASVRAVFADKTQIYITATADAGAWISPGFGWYSTGTAHTFNYGANSGYDVTAVYVDGSPVSITGSYTIQNPWEDHTISVVTTPRASVAFYSNWGCAYVDGNWYTMPTALLLSVGYHDIGFHEEPGYVLVGCVEFHHDGVVDYYYSAYVGSVYLENGDYFVVSYVPWG